SRGTGVASVFGGLIQAAVGSAGGFGATPLKRMGWAANAASRVMARCSVSAAAVPSWTAAGAIKPIPPWRCSWLYQWKKCWQCARASSIEPKRSGKSGLYFRVLNCASEYGLSSETCGRLWVLATSRSIRSAARGLDRMLAPRSAWSVRVPGAMFSFSRVSAMSCSASSADSRDEPTDDVAAVDVEDHVEMEAG